MKTPHRLALACLMLLAAQALTAPLLWDFTQIPPEVWEQRNKEVPVRVSVYKKSEPKDNKKSSKISHNQTIAWQWLN